MKVTLKIMLLSLLSLAAAGLIACKRQETAPKELTEGVTKMDIQKESFGRLPDETEIDLYTLTNKNGVRVRIMTYGATIVSLEVPDRNGKLGDIVLGYDSLAGYLKVNPYFGCIVGRYANRIAGGRFNLDGVTYELAKNDGKNHLHGGIKGFDKVVWRAEPTRQEGAVGVKMSYLSRDGEEGYPGNLSCIAVYELTDQDKLKISYAATTDKPTPVNLTNHSYFNLAGQGNRDILGHELMVNADAYTPIGEGLIPDGEIARVENTPMDFTKLKAMGAQIGEVQGGYDINFVLRGGQGELRLAAQVYEPASGRVMEIYTTEPGIQFYTGNFLDGTITGKGGKVYKQHYGFCLETQHFPDSPNKPNFPSTILRPGEKYSSLTVYRFLAR